jgi:hypothetical protein
MAATCASFIKSRPRLKATLAMWPRRCWERAFDGGNCLTGTDLFEQFGLGRFEFDEPAKHVEHMQEFCRIFCEPVIRLKVS